MAVIPDSNGCFDDAAILAMGLAFDRACASLRGFGTAMTVQEIIATRILEAAAQGERDPARLHHQALKAFDIEESPIVSAA
jgi:hypothetical protein